MKRGLFLATLALFVLSGSATAQLSGGVRSRYSGPIEAHDIKYENALVVQPGNFGPAATLQGAYDWLKSSARDGQMGVLADNNRRVLILSPGNYALDSALSLDTNYVDIASMTEDSRDTVLYRDGITAGQEVVDITATGGIYTLSGFTINGRLGKGDTSGGRGVTFNACTYGTAGTTSHIATVCKITETDCGTIVADAIEASHCRAFLYKAASINAAVGQVGFYGGLSDDDNVVIDDLNPGEDTDVTWAIVRMPEFVNMCFIAWSSVADRAGFVAPHAGGGIFINCQGNHGWPKHALDAVGCRFECYNCIATGDGCFGGDNTSGGWDMSHYEGCKGSMGSFSGCTNWGSNFGGFAINCTGDEGCFAIGREFAGTAINCHVGGKGFAGYGGSTNYGTFSGVAINCSAGLNSFGQGHTSCELSGTAVNCKKVISGLATDIFMQVQANLLVDLPGTATGEVTTFTGVVSGCGPVGPVACVSSPVNVEEWDSGAIFTNNGATGAITITLPDAVSGLTYTFVDKEGDATEDIIITPDTGDTIILAGAALDASDRVIADNDNAVDTAWEIIVFRCLEDNYWNTEQPIGTWDDYGQ